MTVLDEALVRRTVNSAILREAAERVARGETLMDGSWIDAGDLPRRRRRAAFGALWRFVEVLFLQCVLAAIGLGLLLLPLLLF
jgi:hypothetical protein